MKTQLSTDRYIAAHPCLSVFICGFFALGAFGVSEDSKELARSPLLRDGTQLIEAKARAYEEKSSGVWRLVIDQDDQKDRPDRPDRAFRELILLPCTQLAEMRRHIEATPNRHDNEAWFEVSGQVLAYRRQNYVVIKHAAVVGPAEKADEAPASQPSEDSTSTGEADSASRIAAELERDAGPLVRSTGRGKDDSGGGTGRQPSTDSTTVRNAKALPEGTSIVDRRGRLSRDNSAGAAAIDGGSWRFVFDSDASGLADPPLKLLPCLQLERVEAYVQRSGPNAPILLSGAVYLYEGQNYLLPTVFRVPQERRNLTP